jgi:hypothetical protein
LIFSRGSVGRKRGYTMAWIISILKELRTTT